MRKIKTLSAWTRLLFLLALLLTQITYAQELAVNTAMSLVRNNAAGIGLTRNDLQNLRISDAYTDRQTGITMIYLQQTFKGVDIFNAIQSIAIKDHQLLSVAGARFNEVEQLVNNKEGAATFSAGQAIRAAAAELKLSAPQFFVPLKEMNVNKEIEFSDLGISSVNVLSRLIWLPMDKTGKLMLSWQVELQPNGKPDYWLVNIDADKGAVLNKINLNVSCNWLNPVHCYDGIPVPEELLHNVGADYGDYSASAVSSAKYRVIPYPAESPIHPGGTASVQTNPWELAGAGNAATSLKWHDVGNTSYDISRGNNVLAQEDLNGNNGSGITAKSSTALPNLTFDFTPDYTKDPTNTTNQQFAITNLFYWNNIMHDISYQYGFTEPAGNFQTTNGGRGGSGKDAVLADAQDGSGTDNANFSTPRDGSAPRMQMFLWSAPPSFTVNSPSSFAGTKTAAESGFSTANKLSAKGPITNSVVLFNDDAAGTTHLACGAAANAAALAGKIALLERGTCNFTIKVKDAQTAGAIAAIVIDNVPGEYPFSMGGTDNTITIPAVMVSYEDGQTMKSILAANTVLNVTMASGIRLDGDLDNGIIAHEYTHGISNRLTGGPTKVSCLANAEQMGEGWSDYLALMVTTNWSTATVNDGPNSRTMGTYAVGQTPNGPGIRTYPYTTNMSVNPWTYAMLATSTGGEVHVIGEIWCTMVWEMTWAIIQQTGTINTNLYNAAGAGGNNIALYLVMQGMKLQPCSPGFVDGRNAILKADSILYGKAHYAAIWSAFAKRGLGYYAKQGSSSSYTDGVADYSLPPATPAFASASSSFNAMQLNTASLLNWENFNKGKEGNYVIERSSNGVSFTKIGTVTAGESKNYSYTDMNPLQGVNYYRLSQASADNAVVYSEIRTVNFTKVMVSPNPAKDKISIAVDGNSKPLKVALINQNGQQIKTFDMNGAYLQANLPRTPAGTYFIKVTGDGISSTQKLVIQ